MGGGGIIIQQNEVLRKAVCDPSIMSQLPPRCQAEVVVICGKGCPDWTEDDYAYMVAMLSVARHS